MSKNKIIFAISSVILIVLAILTIVAILTLRQNTFSSMIKPNDDVSETNTDSQSNPVTNQPSNAQTGTIYLDKLSKLKKGMIFIAHDLNDKQNPNSINNYFRAVGSETSQQIDIDNKIIGTTYRIAARSNSGKLIIGQDYENKKIALFGNDSKLMLDLTEYLSWENSKCPATYPNYYFTFNNDDTMIGYSIEWLKPAGDVPDSISVEEHKTCGLLRGHYLIDLISEKGQEITSDSNDYLSPVYFSQDNKNIFVITDDGSDDNSFKKNVYRYSINELVSGTVNPSVYTLEGYFGLQLSLTISDTGFAKVSKGTDNSELYSIKLSDGKVNLVKKIIEESFIDGQMPREMDGKIYSIQSQHYYSLPNFTILPYPNQLYAFNAPIDNDILVLQDRDTRFETEPSPRLYWFSFKTGNTTEIKLESYLKLEGVY